MTYEGELHNWNWYKPGKCCIEGDNIAGTIEGLQYEEGMWNAMNPAQKAEVVRLQCQCRPTQCSVQAATTSGPMLSVVSDMIDQLT